VSNLDLAGWVKESLSFDQLILEFYDGEPRSGWVHTSFKSGRNRNQVLVYHEDGTVTTGLPGRA